MSTERAAATQPRLIKVSATGLLLPANAPDWVAVYDGLQQLTFSRAAIPGGARRWAAAKTAVSKLDLCGWSDWRLGELHEWHRQFDYTRTDFALDPALFTIADDEYWSWTGTPYARSSGCAWYVNLHDGDSDWNDQDVQVLVRAVRAGQLSWPLEQAA